MIPNYDAEAGIHYGFIYQNDVGGEAVESLYSKGVDVDYEEAKQDAKQAVLGVAEEINELIRQFTQDVEDALSRVEWVDKVEFMADNDLSLETLDSNGAWDAVEDAWGESQSDRESGRHKLEEDGYVVHTTSDNGIFVIASKYFTYCRECSPCAPSAGYLKDQPGSLKTYCLGAEWFDKYSKLPYDVYSVETGEKIAERVEA